MKTVAMDIETDALDASRIWVVCSKDLDTGETMTFLNVSHIQEEKTRFEEYCKTVGTFVMHNGVGFDGPVINRLLGSCVVDLSKVLDTLILSRLFDYSVEDGHSLDAWGKRLGLHKGKHSDWSKLSQEMIDYCALDVEVTCKLYQKLSKYIFDEDWHDSIRCEHDIQIMCEEMSGVGFKFDKDKAQAYLTEIEHRMDSLESGFQRDFPPKLTEVSRLKLRVKNDGSFYSSVTNAQEKYPRTEVDSDELVCFDWVAFDPASPKQRIDRLWEAGWKPVDKTKGHLLYEREQRDRARQAWRKVR